MQYLTKDNKAYLRIMARTFDSDTMTYLNRILDSHRKKNAELYDRAKQAAEAGDKFSLMRITEKQGRP